MADASGPRPEGHSPEQHAPTLTGLPTELLETIYVQPTQENEDYAATLVSSLRLTCKTMHAKLYDFFYKAVFAFITARNSPSSLNGVLEISRAPAIAPKVQKMTFMDREWRGMYGYHQLEDELRDVPMTDDARLRVKGKMRLVDEDYTQRHLVDNSGLDALIFAQAFASLPNLRDFVIVPSYGLRFQGLNLSR